MTSFFFLKKKLRPFLYCCKLRLINAVNFRNNSILISLDRYAYCLIIWLLCCCVYVDCMFSNKREIFFFNFNILCVEWGSNNTRRWKEMNNRQLSKSFVKRIELEMKKNILKMWEKSLMSNKSIKLWLLSVSRDGG